MELLRFQRRFEWHAGRVKTAALSLPRGNGKSWLAARIVAKHLPKLKQGQEIVLLAGSIEQCRIVFRFAREFLGETGYRYLDSSTRCAITAESGGRLRVQGSNAKTAMGFVNVPLVIADEPGAWEVNSGQLMADAIFTAQGKPRSPLKAVFIGTLAPMGLPGHWWHDLIADGSRRNRFVMCLQGDRKRWADLRHVYAVNPLSRISPEFRETLREERDEALADSRLLARFLSYRLNVPSADESKMLLEVEDWERTLAREVPPAEGRFIWGIDMGQSRSWCAAVCLWQNGRCEAIAVAPGLPSLEAQEKRDRVPKGTYRRLAEAGVLKVAEGLRVPPAGMLLDFARERWGRPRLAISDRFRHDELLDESGRWLRLEPRVTRWSEAAEDIRALRKLSKDGPLACEPQSRLLLTASLGAALVKSDDQGSVRLVKRDTGGRARDDVAAALTLAAGEWVRETRRRKA